ncbi:MAG: M67 family metallopeptidase [Rhodospirillales bacterium]|nr:M67 family metallopeptidase [Rhodospirillales bacterium]
MAVCLPDALEHRIRRHAENCYPNEACGLLTGHRDGELITVTDVHESENVTDADPKTGFEIDPKLRFDLMRALEAAKDGTEIVGHYHSHPDHPAEPSATDLSMTYETDFVWLICSVTEAGTTQLNAFKPREDRSRFEPLELR